MRRTLTSLALWPARKAVDLLLDIAFGPAEPLDKRCPRCGESQYP